MTASTGSPVIGPVLSHVGIFAEDADLLSRFYTEFLGLRETDRGAVLGLTIVFLSADATQHHQLVIAAGRAPDQRSTVCQLSFQLPDLASLRDLVERFREAGVPVQRVVDHGTSWSAYVGDPEGNTVEVYVRTPWYVSQPDSVALNLDQPDDVIEAQTKVRCLAKPSYRSMEDWGAQFEAMVADNSAARVCRSDRRDRGRPLKQGADRSIDQGRPGDELEGLR